MGTSFDRRRAAALTAVALVGWAVGPARAQDPGTGARTGAATGQVTMIVEGGAAGPGDRSVMPLDNGGDPAIKVALADIRAGADAMTATLTTNIGVLSFESAAPSGVGDRPEVRSATFYDAAGAAFALGESPAQLTIESYAPGRRVAFVISAPVRGDAGARRVTVQAVAPIRSD